MLVLWASLRICASVGLRDSRHVHTNAVLEIRFNVDSPNAYSIRIGLSTLQVTTTKIYIVKTNGGHGVQCVASVCSFVSAFCCLFVALKALISSEKVMASRFYKRICADESL